MSETLDFPTVDEAMIANATHTAADLAVVKPTTPDLTKIDLTDVALAMYGKWPDDVKAVKSNLSTLVLDLSTPTKIKEARSLRTRLILEPLAAARKVSATIKSKMAQTSKAVGAELEKIEAGYTEADAMILPKIEAAEAELEAERAKKAKAEQERKDAHLAKIAGIRAAAVKAETAPDMTSARVTIAIQYLEGLPTPTKETFEEYAVEAANAICETLEKLRIIHARLLRAEQAEAEAAELRARLEAQTKMDAPPAGPAGDGSQKPGGEGVDCPAKAGSEHTPQGANRDASAEQSHVAEGSASPTGRGADGPTACGAAPVLSNGYTEGQASQQVLKAEPATADATDRDAPAMTSPRVGAMGAGQAADAAPAGGPGPITMIEPATLADPRDELLREALALTKYAAAPFFSKFPTHPKTTPEWWAGLREQIEALQPKLIAHLEGLA